jgi:hypothetical protein
MSENNQNGKDAEAFKERLRLIRKQLKDKKKEIKNGGVNIVNIVKVEVENVKEDEASDDSEASEKSEKSENKKDVIEMKDMSEKEEKKEKEEMDIDEKTEEIIVQKKGVFSKIYGMFTGWF